MIPSFENLERLRSKYWEENDGHRDVIEELRLMSFIGWLEENRDRLELELELNHD